MVCEEQREEASVGLSGGGVRRIWRRDGKSGAMSAGEEQASSGETVRIEEKRYYRIAETRRRGETARAMAQNKRGLKLV